MNKLFVAFAIVVGGVLILEQGLAIKCFKCNSFHQADCADWFDNVTQHLEDCGAGHSMCRKIVQEVWMEDHWDVRYIRQCAASGDIGRYEGRECQEVYGTYNIRMRYCHCDNQDGCNSAPGVVKPSTSTTVLVPLSLWVAFCILFKVR